MRFYSGFHPFSEQALMELLPHRRLWEYDSCAVFAIPGDLLLQCTVFCVFFLQAPRWKDMSFRRRVVVGISLGIIVA